MTKLFAIRTMLHISFTVTQFSSMYKRNCKGIVNRCPDPYSKSTSNSNASVAFPYEMNNVIDRKEKVFSIRPVL